MGLKVALTNDSFPPALDGVSNAVLNYASIIKQKYGEPVVITPKYLNVTDDYPFEVFRYSSLNIVKNIPYRIGNPLSPGLLTELTKMKFDIIHNHCPFASGVLAHELSKYPVKRKTPLVFTYHTKFDIDLDRFVQNQHINKIARRFTLNNIRAADEVWLVSHGAEQSLRNLGYNGAVRVMPNGTDFPLGRANADVIAEIRRMYKLSPNIPILLFVGRMMWYKNIKLILDVYKKLIDAGIKFTGIFVGDGPDRSAIEHYAKTINVKENCIFTGAEYDRDRMRGFFSCASLFMFPSTFDTSGLVVKEAAACYCPSLLIKGSCASDGVIDGFTGLIAEENAESCAASVIALLRQPEKLAEIGINAGKNIYSTWEDTVDASYKRYEEIIESFNKKSRKHWYKR